MTHIWAQLRLFMGLRAFWNHVIMFARRCGSPHNGLAVQTALPRAVQRWPSAGTRRDQYAGLALLRNEAVHTVLSGPRAVSSLVFCSRKARDG